MARSQANPYWTRPYATGSSITNKEVNRLGHPGMYTGVLKHEGGSLFLTGSNYEFGAAMMIGSGSLNSIATSDYIKLTGGGTIKLKDFGHFGTAVGERTNPILPISVHEISSSATNNDIYFFKRQQ